MNAPQSMSRLDVNKLDPRTTLDSSNSELSIRDRAFVEAYLTIDLPRQLQDAKEKNASLDIFPSLKAYRPPRRLILAEEEPDDYLGETKV